MNICVKCSKEYKNTRTIQSFCSRSCYYESRVGIILQRKGSYSNCKLCDKEFYLFPSYIKTPRARTNEYCSRVCSNRSRLGVGKTEKFIEKCRNSSYWKGEHLPAEHRKKISDTRKLRIASKEIQIIKGKKHANWRGGKTRINKRIRNLKSSRDWREKVFKRDKYTCQICGAHSGNGHAVILHADHIKPFALCPKLRRTLKNGRTLCIDCHKKTDTYGVKTKKNKMQVNQQM